MSKKKIEEIIPDYSEDEMVEPVYEDIDSLESAPIPSFKDKKRAEDEEKVAVEEIDEEEKEDKFVEKMTDKKEKMNEVKTNSNDKYKKRIIGMITISSLFIPGFIVLLIIGSHSTLLINETLIGIIQFLLGISVGVFLVGLVFYIKRRKKIKLNIKHTLIYSVFMTIYILGCLAFTMLLYGPFSGFRDWLVTTAMATMNHQYYCQWFYSDAEIEEVFSHNYIKETGESTNTDLVEINTEKVDVETYANEYEKAVLDREEGTLYKLIELEVNGCKGYLAVIYDPSKVSVATTNRVGVSGQYATTIAKREKAVVAINGAGFKDPGHRSTGGMPRGITIVDGKIITNNEYGKPATGGLIGFTEENKLVLLKNVTAKEALDKGVRDAVSWGPFLIVNGKSAYTSGNGGWGYAARTAIGQRKDGIVLMLVVDSNYNRTKGASMVDMTRIMKQYGAYNAANLDGGTSSVMVIDGELINNPIDSELKNQTRPIATTFIVTE